MSLEEASPPGQRAVLEVFRFPYGEEFARWDMKQRRYRMGVCVGMSVFGVCLTVIMFWLSGWRLDFLLAALAFFALVTTWSWFSLGRVISVSRELSGGFIEYDGRWVRQFAASGKKFGEIDTHRAVGLGLSNSDGSRWTRCATQGKQKIRVSSAVLDGVRLCRDTLKIGDPTVIE